MVIFAPTLSLHFESSVLFLPPPIFVNTCIPFGNHDYNQVAFAQPGTKVVAH